MSFISEMFKSIFRTFGRVIAYIIIGALIYLIASKSVNAKTYRIRMFNPNTTQVLDVRNQSGSYNGKMIRSLVNAWDSSMPANKVTYFNIQNTQAINICTEYGILSNSVACSVRADYMKYYYYDSNGNTYEITDSCQSAITKNTIIYNANNTTTYQYKINTACSFTPSVAVAGFQQEIGWVYNLAAQQGSGSSAIVVSNFTITQDATEGDQIMQNATENANRIIANQNQNTEAILGGIEDLNGNITSVVTGIDDVNDTLTDSSVDNPSSAINSMSNSVATNGTISTLILLPVTLYQSVLNNVNGTCSPFTLGTLYGTTLTLPCINISSFLGTALYGVIDVLISGFFILAIRKKFVDIFNHLTNLRTGDNELE